MSVDDLMNELNKVIKACAAAGITYDEAMTAMKAFGRIPIENEKVFVLSGAETFVPKNDLEIFEPVVAKITPPDFIIEDLSKEPLSIALVSHAHEIQSPRENTIYLNNGDQTMMMYKDGEFRFISSIY